ncbi:unnamed protein product, partial [Hapterophycus canaliculatus]
MGGKFVRWKAGVRTRLLCKGLNVSGLFPLVGGETRQGVGGYHVNWERVSPVFPLVLVHRRCCCIVSAQCMFSVGPNRVCAFRELCSLFWMTRKKGGSVAKRGKRDSSPWLFLSPLEIEVDKGRDKYNYDE